MKPGIYRRGEFTLEQYAALDAVNQSTLKAMDRSPLHYRHRLEHQQEITVPMRLGAVAHCAVLEPDELERRFAVYTVEGKLTKAGKPRKSDSFAGKDYEMFAEAARAAGQQVIKQKELDAAIRLGEAVRRNKLAQRYLKRGVAEVVLIWIDAETGILCKARLDWISLSVPDVIGELKSATDVSPRVFSSAFAKLGYDVQAAFYTDGYKACTGREPGFKVFAVESGEPHDSVVYDLNEAIDAGREIYRGYLRKLAECRAANRWPGQAEEAELALRLPRWRDPFEEDEADPMFEELEGLEV